MEKISFPIGSKTIGGTNRLLLQSMSDHKTSDVAYQVRLTKKLTRMGLDLMRFSVLDSDDAKALSQIKKQVSVPIIADIHFDHNLALLAINSGADKIRINPGNIGSEAALRDVIQACKEKGIPMRIGVNSGSLNKYRGKTSSPVDEFLLALDETLAVYESEGFDHLVLSLKSSDPLLTQELYTKAEAKYPYPLHLGLTESGFGVMGSAKSALALFPLLQAGIGSTLRVSLADNRVDEMRVAKTLLQASGRWSNLPRLIVCPSCGRTQIDLKPIARLVANKLDTVFKPITIAVMGCPVNGIGEAKGATYGIAGSGKKDVYLLFSYGKPIGLYPKKEALTKLYSLIDNA